MTDCTKGKILELFCGLGGWSKGFAELGYHCTGIDIKNLGYPYNFIKADLYDWEPKEPYDIVLASPPCTEFSVLKNVNHGNADERMGLDLVYRTFELIDKIKPKYYVIENVPGLGKFLPKPRDIVRYGRTKPHKEAWLWGNFPPLPMLESSIYHRHSDYSGNDPRRGLIPIQLSRAMAQAMTN